MLEKEADPKNRPIIAKAVISPFKSVHKVKGKNVTTILRWYTNEVGVYMCRHVYARVQTVTRMFSLFNHHLPSCTKVARRSSTSLSYSIRLAAALLFPQIDGSTRCSFKIHLI